MDFNKLNTGKKGEALASRYLKTQGYKIIEKNYRTKRGELDIICRDKDCIVFVEVRTYTNREFGLPEYSITRDKQARISKVALFYIKQHALQDAACRFDVVCIENKDGHRPDIRLIKNAFELDTRFCY